MGYFSNGTEGEMYFEQYCSKCIHGDVTCPVLQAHQLYNYKDCNNDDSILHMLIPRSDGVGNKQCKMFIEASTASITTHKETANFVVQQIIAVRWYTLGLPWCHSDHAGTMIMAGSDDPHVATAICDTADFAGNDYDHDTAIALSQHIVDLHNAAIGLRKSEE